MEHAGNSKRSTRASKKHLSTDYEWEMIDTIAWFQCMLGQIYRLNVSMRPKAREDRKYDAGVGVTAQQIINSNHLCHTK